MGRLILVRGAFVIILTVGPANGADLSLVKAPPIPTPALTWSGFYVGLNAGGAISDEDWFFPSTALNEVSQAPVGAPFNIASGGKSSSAALVGGQIGYNYQLGNWVLGAEADFDWAGLSGAHKDPTFPNIDQSRTDFVSTVAARIGYAWDRLLIFGKLGSGWAHTTFSTRAATTFTVGDPGSPPSTIVGNTLENRDVVNRFGLSLGAGAEYAISQNWSAKAEYDFVDLGRYRATLSPLQAGLAPFNEDIRQQIHMLKLGLNFRPAAVAADLSSYAQLRSSGSGPRFYGGAEYLLWSLKGAPLSVPLVSSGPESNKEGFLVNANSTILYGAPFSPASGGNDTQAFPLFSGGRLTFGYWLDDAHRMAIEGSGFLVQTRTAGFQATGDSTTGQPAMRIPVYNNVPYAPGGACDPDNPTACLIGRTEDGVPISIPGDLYGSVKITNSLQLWGADGTLALPAYRYGKWEVTPLLGVRYLQLSESLRISATLIGLPSSDLYAGQSGTATDSFDTRNQFFGAVLGLRGATHWGPISLEMTGRMAFGLSHEVLNVSGFYQDFGAAFASSSGPYGIFAMPNNSGRFIRNEFAVVPETQVKLGYDLSPSVRVTIGYDFLYDSTVIRPGDQINRNIPKGQTFQQDGTLPSQSSPASLFKTTDFYAHGLNVGVSARF